MAAPEVWQKMKLRCPIGSTGRKRFVMKTWKYRDFYGCTATIKKLIDGTFQARSRTMSGTPIRNSNHKTRELAFAALKKDTDGLCEVK